MMNSELGILEVGTATSPKGEVSIAKPLPKDIRKRSFAYSLRAIRLHQSLQSKKDSTGWISGRQFLRAATAIGANVEEAQSGESRADFIHKLGIAQKEARESLYWLRLLSESGIVPRSTLESLISETEELIAVITAIIVKSKGGR
ncbi:MAG: four helix bundle protein [Deltaproteobacteria bacterium]